MMHEAAQDVAAQSWVKGNERKCAGSGSKGRGRGDRRWACIL